MTEELAKGYACHTCGEWHAFPAYVYAHWDLLIKHTCDRCGALHDIVRGHADLIEAGRNHAL